MFRLTSSLILILQCITIIFVFSPNVEGTFHEKWCLKVKLFCSKGIKQNYAESILANHNNLRQRVASGNFEDLESASKMKRMSKYESKLTFYAQRRAEMCMDVLPPQLHSKVYYYQHGLRTTVGFNVDVVSEIRERGTSSTRQERATDVRIEEAIVRWSSNPNSNEFRQMITSATTRIGCGHTICRKNLENNMEEVKEYHVCYYLPALNVNHAPYETGPACSQCQNGCSEEYNSLCE